MKRILIASALALAAGGQALAADLPPPPPAPRAPATYVPVAPYYNWTGFYIGGNLGAGFTSGSYSDTLGSTFTNSSNTTFLGGGQVGVNYEFWGGVVTSTLIKATRTDIKANIGSPFTPRPASLLRRNGKVAGVQAAHQFPGNDLSPTRNVRSCN